MLKYFFLMNINSYVFSLKLFFKKYNKKYILLNKN